MKIKLEFKKPFVLILGLMVIGSLFCGCKPPVVDQVEPTKLVKIETLSNGIDSGFSIYPGVVQASQRAILAFGDEGKIIILNAQEGTQVTNGQMIAQLDQRQFQAQLDSSISSMKQLEVDYESSSNLYVKEVISKIEYLKSKRNYEISQEKVKSAYKVLQDSVIFAPFDGTISKRFVENYENVVAKQEIVHIDDLNIIEIVIDMPERDIAIAKKVKTNQFLATFNSITNIDFPIDIKEFATKADSVAQTFQVTFIMKAPTEAHVLPGMSAQIKIPFSQSSGNSFPLPIGAVFANPNGANTKCVWVVNPDSMRVNLRKVTASSLKDDEIIVTDGLKKGEMVVTSGVNQLKENSKVQKLDIKNWK